ncbi:MAG TPA: zinc metalloprotease HtpX [Anaerolineae bacterium]|nr:zinc metalloprotease HtpX [Anaerolineae bacterium]
MLNKHELLNHKFHNWLHTASLLLAMLIIFTSLGYLLAGTQGLIWAITLGLFLILFSRQAPANLMMRLFRGQPIAPHQAPDLYQRLYTLSKRAQLKTPPQLYYINSPTLNAFAVGTRQQPAIGITAGLLRHLNAREINAILAHEISHISSNDLQVLGLANTMSRTTQILSTVGQILLFLNLPLLLTGRVAFPWLLIITLLVAPTIMTLLQLALTRTREYDADLSATRLTNDPHALITALQRLEAHGRPFWHRIFPLPTTPTLFRTHPHTNARIARLRSLYHNPTPTSNILWA